MIVEVSWISDDKQTYRGTVIHGYYPKDESKWIEVGAVVEFSIKKIRGISKKPDRARAPAPLSRAAGGPARV